jgi:hypothetical protein
MDKKYTKPDDWVDEVLASDPVYNIIDPSDDSIIYEDVDIARSTEVITSGTGVTAERMNNLETGLDGVDTALSLLTSLTVTATAAGTTTLTVSSDRIQQFTGTTTQTITLPVVSTLELGDCFTIINSSTGILTVNSSGGNLIKSVQPGTTCQFICVAITGTTAASWKYPSYDPAQTIHGAVNKTTPVDADEVGIWDSVTGLLNRLSWENIKATLKTYFDTLYPPITQSVFFPPGRLSLESGVPVSTTSQTNKTMLYYVLMAGKLVRLYTGTAWVIRSINSELSLDVSGFTASTMYDIFLYDNAGTPALDSASTNRTTNLPFFEGVMTKSGDTTRLYIGSIYMDSGSKLQETTSISSIFNMYNPVKKRLYCFDTTDSYTYSTTTMRAAHEDTTDGIGRVSCVVGYSVNSVSVRRRQMFSNDTATVVATIGIGIDSTSVNSAQIGLATQVSSANFLAFAECEYAGYLGVGYHYIQQLEKGGDAGVTTWFGDAGVSNRQSGMIVEMVG